MPTFFLDCLIYAATALGTALAIKVALRYRADRRRHARCIFCDGRDGDHAYCCQRPGARI